MASKESLISSKTGNALLFDMDGTLTPARKKVSQEVFQTLNQLMEAGHRVCVVSGSPYPYIHQQLLLDGLDWHSDLILMPCNGTQIWSRSDSNQDYDQTYSVTMKSFLVDSTNLSDPYKELVTNILELQLYAMRKYDFSTTGNFVSDRGSMLNWSMIGRDASHEVRDAFSLEEASKPIRKHLRECLRVRLDDSGLHGIDLTLGGSTSIDIFPKGWDKTYALKHLAAGVDSWFWGDKCHALGNDHALWKALQPFGRSFAVDTPEDTLQSLGALQAEGKL